MQAVVDRMIRVFTSRRPLPDDQSKGGNEEAVELATELLATYKNRLVRRSLSAANPLNKLPQVLRQSPRHSAASPPLPGGARRQPILPARQSLDRLS